MFFPTTQEVCGEMMRKMMDELTKTRTKNLLHMWRSALMLMPGQRARAKSHHRGITWHFYTFLCPKAAGSLICQGSMAGLEGSLCLAGHSTIPVMHLQRGSGDNGVAGLIQLAWHSQPNWGGGQNCPFQPSQPCPDISFQPRKGSRQQGAL